MYYVELSDEFRSHVLRCRQSLWLNTIKKDLGLTFYELDNHPELSPAGDTGIWRKRKNKLMCPNKNTLKRVDGVIKGSQSIYEHEVWFLLSLDKISKSKYRNWVRNKYRYGALIENAMSSVAPRLEFYLSDEIDSIDCWMKYFSIVIACLVFSEFYPSWKMDRERCIEYLLILHDSLIGIFSDSDLFCEVLELFSRIILIFEKPHRLKEMLSRLYSRRIEETT